MNYTRPAPERQPNTGDLLDPAPGPTCPRSTDALPDPQRWLDHVPPPKRSTVANAFHYAVRQGASTPHAVWCAVSQDVQRRLQWSTTPASRTFLHQVLDLLQTDKDAALLYAKSVIEYEQLPYAEQRKIKAQRGVQYLKTSMRGKPATEAQYGLLRRLGYQDALPTDRAEASELIDRLITQQGGGR